MSIGSSVALATERVLAPIEGMHRAIAARGFAAMGRVGRPLGTVYDAALKGVYESIRVTAAFAGVAVDDTVTIPPSMADRAEAVVNGVWGDALGRYEDRLGTSMSLRDHAGADVGGRSPAVPEATGHIVVLVHGLVETERCWQGTEGATGLIEELCHEPALTPLALRYNTGLRVSQNGAKLASLIERVRAGWPVPVESISLVGSSMGGLVIRSACESARSSDQCWIDDVTNVVAIGSPHRGTPLEKFVNVVAWGLRIAPQTRPLAAFLDGRSVGIKDLGFGAIVDEDWLDVDPSALLPNTVGDHPLPPDIDHHFVAAVVTEDPSHPVGALIGDLVVRTQSSTGRRHLRPTNTVVLGGVHHFELLKNRAVIDHVIRWLAPAT